MLSAVHPYMHFYRTNTVSSSNMIMSITSARHCDSFFSYLFCFPNNLPAATGCPPGWFKLEDQNAPVGRCYYRSQMGRAESRESFSGAHDECARRGGTMASMDTISEWERLVESGLVPAHHRAASAYWLDVQFTVVVNENGTREIGVWNASDISLQELRVLQSSVSAECVRDPSKPVMAIGRVQPNTTMCVTMTFQHHCAFWKATRCDDGRQVFCERGTVGS